MSQIQNSCLHAKTFIEPTILLGLAFLAGSTRLIQHLPGASKGGLLMSAGLASIGCCLYDPNHNKPEYSHLKAIAWKGAMIALGAVCTSFAAKPLKGRVSLSSTAAIKFAALELAAIAITTTCTSSLKHTHRYYATRPLKWRTLDIEKRTELVKEFYKAGLPAISIINAPINVTPDTFLDPYATFKENLDSYSGAQLSWYCLFLIRDNYSSEDVILNFRIMMRCQQTGIPMFRWVMDQTHLNYLKDKIEMQKMLYQTFQQYPMYRLYCQMCSHYWDDTFLSQGKAPFRSLEEVRAQLKPSDVKAMDEQTLFFYYNVFRSNAGLWNSLSENVQEAFLIQLFDFGFPSFMDFGTLPDGFVAHVNALSTKDITQLNPVLWALDIQNSKTPKKLSFQHVYALNQIPQQRYKVAYYLSSEVVQAAAKDDLLVRALIMQFQTTQDPCNSLYGFTALSPADQAKLRELFGNNKGLLDGQQGGPQDEEAFVF